MTNQQQQQGKQPPVHAFPCEVCQRFGLLRPAFTFIADDLAVCAAHHREWLRTVD